MAGWRERRGFATAIVKFLLLALLGAGVAKYDFLIFPIRSERAVNFFLGIIPKPVTPTPLHPLSTFWNLFVTFLVNRI